MKEDVDSNKVLPYEFQLVQASHDLRVADISDVRLDLGVDIELVAVDFRVRGDVSVVEGELVGVMRPRGSDSGYVVGVLAAHYRATAALILRASVNFKSPAIALS